MFALERSLSQLKIEAFPNRESRVSSGMIKATYNPESIDLSYQADYESRNYIDAGELSNCFKQLRPGDLKLDLIFDQQLPDNTGSVDEQLSRLRELCFLLNGSTGEPSFLKITWGNMNWNGRGYFAGRMASLAIHYTLFDRDATPLRAKASLTVTADESLTIQRSTQWITGVKGGMFTIPDLISLPLLAATAGMAAAGGGTDYLSLAYINDLDSFGSLTAGASLVAGLSR